MLLINFDNNITQILEFYWTEYTLLIIVKLKINRDVSFISNS